MVKIRLKRIGMKKMPFYRVVVAVIHIDNERAQYWIKCGAQPTDTARVLLKKSGAIEG